jgi:hypothetical protein
MSLEETYYEINQILGKNAEPLESVRLVETYRRYLKPDREPFPDPKMALNCAGFTVRATYGEFPLVQLG